VPPPEFLFTSAVLANFCSLMSVLAMVPLDTTVNPSLLLTKLPRGSTCPAVDNLKGHVIV
jgi:hypothetical protein